EKFKNLAGSRLLLGRSRAEWIKDLSQTDPSIKETAIKMVAQYGTAADDAVPKLIPLLNDRDASIRVHAALALGEIGLADQEQKIADQAVKELVRALYDPQSYIRFHAATAIGRVAMTADARPAIPKLVDMLTTNRDYGAWQ